MAVAKVILNGNTLIDVTDKTVTSSNLVSPNTALGADGTTVTGALVTKSASDVTVSGATTTIPAGVYSSQVQKTVSSGSATTPATTITANPTISVSSSGLITASVSGSKSVSPTVSAGYVSTGTAGTITVSGSNTQQLTTQAAQTITPTTSNQTISSGTFLTGDQTILGDTNLVASNIMSGVSIFGVTGTLEPGGNLRSLTINENLLYSQSLSYNAQQGFLVYEHTCDVIGNNVSFTFAGTVPWTLGDTFNINGSFTVTQSGSSENITMNTDFVMASENIILDFSYTGSDLIERIDLTRYDDDRIQLTFFRRNISSNIKLVGNFQILGYTKGFDIINLNLIDNPQAMIAFKAIALNNDYITSSAGFQTIFSSIYGVSRGAYAFRSFTGSSTFCFNNVNAINMYGFYGITGASPRPTFSFPEVKSIYNSAFQKAQIGHIYAPKCTLIGSSAFHECYYLEEANFPLVTSIQTYAFGYCSSLTTVSFPICTTIGSYAFTNCSRLTEVSFPLCTQIYPSAFYLCYSLNTVSFPECSQIWHYAFNNCSALTSINFPKCEWIGNSAFTNCSYLTEVSFPLCTEIASNAFGNCYSLTSINLPECVSINHYVFLNCSKLISISLPKCERILDRTFNNCSNLQTISLPKLSSIGAYVFMYCTSLSAAYFMSSSVVTAGPQIFTNTPMHYSSYLGYFGSIYVPSSLLASYKTATNWTTYSSRMVGI